MQVSGRAINYAHNELNLVREVTEGPNTLASYRYVGRRIASADYGNGTRTIYQYDGMKEMPNPLGDFGVKRIIKTTNVRIPHGDEIDVLSYKWDKVGNKKQRKDIRLGGPQLTHDYVYGPARRLVKTTVTDGNDSVLRQTSYKMDGVGNRKVVTGSPDIGPWVGSYIMDPTLPEPGDFQMSQYTTTASDSREYSKNGNLTSFSDYIIGVVNIEYDYCDRMVEFEHEDDKHTYRYDVFGRRISKVVDADGVADGPTETRYFYAGAHLIEEENGATLATYVYGGASLYDSPGDDVWLYDTPGDDKIIMTRGGQDYHYHGDDTGSVTAVTDNAGNVVERYRFADYGTPRIVNGQGETLTASAIGNSFLFRGQEFDVETGLYYSGGATSLDGSSKEPAYLDPEAGRYTTRGPEDTLGNQYTAFGNNPGSEQALSIIGILIALNRPSSAGFADSGAGTAEAMLNPMPAGLYNPGERPDQSFSGGDAFTAVWYTLAPARGGLGKLNDDWVDQLMYTLAPARGLDKASPCLSIMSTPMPVWDDTDIVHIVPTHSGWAQTDYNLLPGPILCLLEGDPDFDLLPGNSGWFLTAPPVSRLGDILAEKEHGDILPPVSRLGDIVVHSK